MATNQTGYGETIQYTNGSGNDVVSGQPVMQGRFACIPVNDVADGETGPAYLEGIFELPASGTLGSAGMRVYLDTTNGVVTPTAGAFYIAGCTTEAKSATTTDYVGVKLLGSGDVVT